jgi:hypothetical protein
MKPKVLIDIQKNKFTNLHVETKHALSLQRNYLSESL